ncbi:MAG: 2-succinyl-6-hydroxy-2,4-cyclohexadiene-1-carboxylate synthase [Ignavibacteriaceae bacterium]|nr:2-succinyl-6-hydroxy-2,4-cyclohexadiene-1-carboxylate synthase [Ignavibacteriaceae bacterium]
MLIQTANVKLNLEPGIPDGKKDILLFIHGFTGSALEWQHIFPLINPAYDCVAVDLVGHGLSDSPESSLYYSASSITSQLYNLIKQLPAKKVILAGYSMGGRAALSFAVKHPSLIKALILESASPGIKDVEERNARINNDERLVEFILTKGSNEFVNHWMNIELFSSQKKLPKDILEQQFRAKLKNNKMGLSNSLIGFGTGTMPQLYDVLEKLNFPALLVTGKLDIKFTQINSKIVFDFKNAAHTVIADAGHNAHLEKPDIFSAELNKFLNSLD